MHVVKKILHVLSLGLLGFLTVAGITAITFSLIITDREVIKSWPADAGVYTKVSDQLLALTERPEEEGEESIDAALADTPLDRDALNAAIKTVYSPAYWQSKYDQLADGFYDWLEGQQPELKFTLAFNDKTDQLADALEQELTRQLAAYPACPAGTDFGQFDPFKATCLPRGVNPRTAARQFTNELRGADSFLADATVTQDDLNLDPEFEQNAVSAYNAFEILPWILAAVLVGLALVAVLTAKTVLHGFRKVGQLLFGIGLVSWISLFAVNRLLSDFSFRPREGEVDPDAFNDIAQPLVRAIVDDVTTTGLWVSLFVVLIGTLIWLGAFIWHKAHHGDEAQAIAAKARGERPAAKESKLPPPLNPDESKDKSK